MKKTIKILLVDDHLIVREGVKHILSLQKKYEIVVDEAENGEEAIQKALENDYDVILMDIQMPVINGIEAVQTIIKKKKQSRIIALSVFDDDYYIHRMLTAGVSGYILKSTGPEELSKAISTMLEGKKFYGNEIGLKLMDQKFNFKNHSSGFPSPSVENLSSREIQVLALIADGNKNDEIANQLKLSKRTIEGYRQKIMQKINIKTTSALIKFAVLNKIGNKSD